MSNQLNKMRAFIPALGLIFGAGIGLIIGSVVDSFIKNSLAPAFGLIFGAGIGLIIGSAVYSFIKNK